MVKKKIIAASIITASLVGTMTITAIAGKVNLADLRTDNESLSTLSKSLRNLVSDDESAASETPSRDFRISRFGIGMDVNLICDILGVTREELSQQLKDNEGDIYKILEDAGKLDEYKTTALAQYKEKIDKAVADGRITQEKADELYAAMEESLNKSDGNLEIHIGGKTNLGDIPERAERSKFMLDIGSICEFLGITEEELSQKLTENDGDIYKILEDSGKLEEYKAAALEKYKTSLDEKVAGGKITQEKADEMYASMKESLENFDGNLRMNFRMHAEGDKTKEKFRSGDGEGFTFNFPNVSEYFGRGSKDNSSAASGLTVKDL